MLLEESFYVQINTPALHECIHLMDLLLKKYLVRMELVFTHYSLF